MYLKNLKLWNFRKYGSSDDMDLSRPNLDLTFAKGLNVLIGENDSGKTAIIDAIKLVLKTHSYEWMAVEDDDFFENSGKFRIELLFDDMEAQAYHFTEYLGFNGEGASATPYLKLNYEVTRKNGKIVPSDIRAGVDSFGAILKAGAKEQLKTTYLKPLRDANLDLTPKKNSRLSQIFHAHEAFSGTDTHSLVEQFIEFNRSVANYFSGVNSKSENIPDLRGKALKDSIDNYIQAFIDPNFESLVQVSSANIKAILERLILQMNGHVNPGLGTMNKLFMATELLHLEKENWTGLRLGLIEELEAHLHPQAQMKVIEALQKNRDIQLILTTHSPNLASKIKLENIILCHDSSAYPLGSAYTKLDETKGDYDYLERFLDVTKANLFFAKGLILVEGWSEEILIPALAKKMKAQGLLTKDLTEAGVSIVNVGNTEFLRFSRIFLRKRLPNLSLPVSILTDVDVREYEKCPKVDESGGVVNKGKKTQYEYIKIDQQRIQKISTRKIKDLEKNYSDQSVRVFVTPKWTLEYSLFQSKTFGFIVKNILDGIYPRIEKDNYEKSLAIKLFNKNLNKTQFSYSLAKRLDPNSSQFDPSIVIYEDDEYIGPILDAIKYVCN